MLAQIVQKFSYEDENNSRLPKSLTLKMKINVKNKKDVIWCNYGGLVTTRIQTKYKLFIFELNMVQSIHN